MNINTYAFTKKISGIDILKNNLEDIAGTLSSPVYWKNKKGIYLGVNDAELKMLGLNSCNDMIGQTDRDMLWRAQAPMLMGNDQEVMSTEHTQTYIESVQRSNGTIVHCLSHKTPLRSRTGKIMGILGFSFSLGHDKQIATACAEMMNIVPDPGVRNHFQECELRSRIASLGLTQRQADCLYYLIKGMTMKQIARALHLSPRTVEHYLDAIKIKLNCDYRSELIEKVFK